MKNMTLWNEGDWIAAIAALALFGFLAAGGLLVFYGPFKENGKHTGEGNANFDAGLRVQDVDWGLRDTVDIQSIGESLGLVWRDMVVMPSNNRLLVLAKP